MEDGQNDGYRHVRGGLNVVFVDSGLTVLKIMMNLAITVEGFVRT